jgi:chromosome segregation ATPase
MSAEQAGGVGSGEVDATAADPAPERAVNARLSQAEATLAAAARAASAAEHRAAAEIRALEADLNRWRTEADRARKALELRHEEELQHERKAKEEAIAAAEARLEEIEHLADAAEERIAAAERRAETAERSVADEGARAREGAAAWLRERIDEIRRGD